MSELTEWNGNVEWDNLPVEIRQDIESINRAEDDFAHAGMITGKRMCALKEKVSHGQFEVLADKYLRLKKYQRTILMRIYKEFGQKSTAVDFSTIALLELSRAPEPQAALEEAVTRKEQGEDITAKQAKEIARLHKEIEAQKKLEASKQPSLSNLVPELARMHRAGTIPEATALEFSKIDPDIQRMVILPKYQQVSTQQNEINVLKEEKTRALERESKEREARESLQADYDSAVEQGAQAVIAEKDKEIKRKEKELEQFKIDFRQEIERNHTAMIEKRVRAEWKVKLDEETKARERAEREAKQQKERAQLLVDQNRLDRNKLEAAEAALKATHPLEKDGEHARSVGFLAQDLKSKIKKLESDCEPHQRKLTDAALAEIQAILNAYFGEQSFIEMEM